MSDPTFGCPVLPADHTITLDLEALDAESALVAFGF
jgi:hypothetical protein